MSKVYLSPLATWTGCSEYHLDLLPFCNVLAQHGCYGFYIPLSAREPYVACSSLLILLQAFALCCRMLCLI